MKKLSKIIFVAALLGQGFALLGCDPETHPDPHLVQSANGQRQAMQPGQPQQPPTSDKK